MARTYIRWHDYEIGIIEIDIGRFFKFSWTYFLALSSKQMGTKIVQQY